MSRRRHDYRAPILAIISEVAAKHGLTQEQILCLDRTRRFAWPRQEVMYRAHQETGFGRVRIGKVLGLDCQTVWHGIQRHKERMKAAEHGQNVQP